MTDKNTLDLARQWAADIDADRQTLSQDTIDAAVEVIRDLPDSWVDANKLRELLDKWATNPFPTSDEVAVLNDVEALLPAPPTPESAAPRPEDVPVGEPWQVEIDGQAAIGYRNSPGSTFPWATIRDEEPAADYCIDSDVTLVARLAPETTEQDDEEASSNKEAMGESMADFADRIFGRLPVGEDLCDHVNLTSVENHQERVRAAFLTRPTPTATDTAMCGATKKRRGGAISRTTEHSAPQAPRPPSSAPTPESRRRTTMTSNQRTEHFIDAPLRTVNWDPEEVPQGFVEVTFLIPETRRRWGRRTVADLTIKDKADDQ